MIDETKKIETDVCQDGHPLDPAQVGRIRREFLSGVVLALVTCPDASGEPIWMWDYAEALYQEGKRKGYLP